MKPGGVFERWVGVATVLGGAESVKFGGDVTGKDLVSVIKDSDCPSRGM